MKFYLFWLGSLLEKIVAISLVGVGDGGLFYIRRRGGRRGGHKARVPHHTRQGCHGHGQRVRELKKLRFYDCV
jgi:hypothetical protein